MTDFDPDDYPKQRREIRSETSYVSSVFLSRSGAKSQASCQPEPSWLTAAASDASQPQTFELGRLWDEVCAGTWRFRDAFTTAERHLAVIERVQASPRTFTQIRNLEILRRVLRGQMPKVVAPDMGVGVSTVATVSHECLRWMGLNCRTSNAPVLLAIAAFAAAHRPQSVALGRLTRIRSNVDKYWLVSVSRPDLDFPVQLSQAEAACVRGLLAGYTHAEISTHRATSPRTVANQLAMAFKKLGVSGRAAVLQLLIARRLELKAEHCPPSDTLLRN